MSNLELFIPGVEDYWYEKMLNEDPRTMDYNAGYDVSYSGYDYQTGCIAFPKDRWQAKYDNRINNNRFFAYVKDVDKDLFVGYVNYQYNDFAKRYECGVVIEGKYRGLCYGQRALALLIEHAKRNGIDYLYDNFEVKRGHVLEMFLSLGFVIVEYTTWKKFGKTVEGVVVRIKLN